MDKLIAVCTIMGIGLLGLFIGIYMSDDED